MADEQPQSQIETPPELQPTFFQRYQRIFWIGLIIAALGVAGLLTYLLFFRTTIPAPEYLGDVRISIEAPSEIASGSEISYQLEIENLSNTKLTSMVLEVFYPSGFEFIDSAPDSEALPADFRAGPAPGLWGGAGPAQFKFPDLEKSQVHELIIVGKLSGNIQEIKTFNAKLRYIPENFRSTFVAEASSSTLILAPNLNIAIKAPVEIISGQTINYQIEVSNIADKSFSDLELVVKYPEKLETAAESQFKIISLDPGQHQVSSVSGRLHEEAGRESLISAELLLKDEKGEKILVGTSFAFTRMIAAPLLLSHQLVPFTDTVKIGERLKFELEYENTSQVGLTDVQIMMIVEQPFSPNFFEIETKKGQVQADRILWIPASVPELQVLTPGMKGKFQFEIALKDSLSASAIRNPRLSMRSSFLAREVAERVFTKTLEQKVETKLALSGSVAGETTNFRVSLEVKNTVNDVSDAILNAIIPRADAVLLADSVSPDQEKTNLQFNSLSGRITWQAGRVPAFGSRRISFEIVITPTEKDSRGLSLLKDIAVIGQDEFTGKEVSSNVLQLSAD